MNQTEQNVSQNQPGTVYLVGAGPGDPGLITVRGRDLLTRADVIVYDHLLDKVLLKLAHPQTELIYVGKKAGQHTVPQEQINQILVDKAKQANIIVRLKGGDPFVFGRGGEEVLALVEAGIPFEVVPGVTAGVAVPACAGIPVTHRDFASQLAFITGHEDAARTDTSQIDWPSLARWPGTLVFYMGVKNLPLICEQLLQNGMAPDTPAAIIASGNTPRQHTVCSTLAHLPADARHENIAPPAIIVIGQVVTLRDKLQWFEKRPLFSQRIVVTRSRRQASELVEQLTLLGADVLEFPTIRIEPPRDPQPLENAIIQILRYDWIIFTSVNGVDSFFQVLTSQGFDARRLASAKICAIGPATAARLQTFGITADLVPAQFIAESIVEALRTRESLEDMRFLLPRADIARPDLANLLRHEEAIVDEIIAYHTVPETGPARDELIQALEQNTIDWITFTSSSTAANFLAQIDAELLRKSKARLASIGPVTSAALQKAGLTVALEAVPFTIPALVLALCRAESERNNNSL